MTYPYVKARYDYGPRKATAGLCIHGAEAEAGVVGYLSRNPARGVSANFVCERSGRMVRMLPFGNASGSLNPADRSTDKGFYGHTTLVDVLGQFWTDPNAAVISVEGEWYAAKGPNQAQVDGLAAWAADMRVRYPSLRGTIGHADQTNTKGCPGQTPLMLAAFDAMGGHGLWKVAPVDQFNVTVDTVLSVPLGTILYDNDALTASPANVTINPARDLPLLGIFADNRRLVAYQPAGATVPHSYWTKPGIGTAKAKPVTPVSVQLSIAGTVVYP